MNSNRRRLWPLCLLALALCPFLSLADETHDTEPTEDGP